MSDGGYELLNKILLSDSFSGKIIGIDGNYFVVKSLKDNKIVYISKDEIHNYSILNSAVDFGGNSKLILLYLNLYRFRHAYMHDEIYALNTSNIDPLPHQIEAVYDYMLKAIEKTGRLRFLLADDVGAGKTIMAGLIIKELIHRHHIKRILIVVPKILEDKWKRDLESKFFFKNIYIVKRDTWEGFRNLISRKDFEGIFITSLDFAKQEDKRKIFASVEWDLVIFDEAHKLSARIFGLRAGETQRYKLAKELAKKTRHILLLTATPHTGHTDRFILLLKILDENLFNIDMSIEKIREILLNEEVPMFLRRLKTEFVDINGRKLIPERKVSTITFELNEEELEIYNELTKYIKFLYDLSKKNKNYWLVMLIFQKRFASSLYAARKSLERRLKVLEYIREKAIRIRKEKVEFELEGEEDENIVLEKIYDKSAIEQEIEYLKKLLDMIDNYYGEDTKLQKLIETLRNIKRINPKEKVVIFSEYKDTVEYLKGMLKKSGFSSVIIHGDMDYKSKLEALERFKKENIDILIATDAAGEGIDLQDVSHIMINYDIPWSPVVLEQRMGRIHRYGQKKTPYIYNFVAANTREGYVLKRLFEKLEEIRNWLGEKIYDIIGEIIEDEEKFIEHISKAAIEYGGEFVNRLFVQEELSKKVQEIEKFVKKPKDYKASIYKLELSKRTRIVPEYFEKILLEALKILYNIKFKAPIAEYYESGKIVRIWRLPKLIAKSLGIKEYFTVYPTAFRKYDYNDIEFITPEHPAFDKILSMLKEKISIDLIRGCLVKVDKGDFEGMLHVYLLEVRNDSTNNIIEQGLVVILENSSGCKILPDDIISYLSDLSIKDKNIEIPNIIENKVKPYLEKIKSDILKKVKRKIEKDIEYQKGLIDAAFSDILDKLDKEINEKKEQLSIELNPKLRKKLREEIEQLEKKRKLYYESWQNKIKEIEKWKEITVKYEKLTVLYAVPEYKLVRLNIISEEQDLMYSDPEVERIAMEIVIRYEKENGRIPKDVSQEYKGYDIESYNPVTGEIRYIEVKGRAEEGDIVMTQHEWATAERLGDSYWLYVVYNTKRLPPEQLKPILVQNPAKKLKPKIIRRYRIKREDILRSSQVGE